MTIQTLRKLTPWTLGIFVGAFTIACSGGDDSTAAVDSTDDDPMNMENSSSGGTAGKDANDDPDDELEKKDDGSGGSAGAAGAPNDEPEAPTVLESFPSDDDAGFLPEDSFEITFSVPMDPDSVEAAFSSSELTADDVEFSWSDDKTVLTVDPVENLDVNSGVNLNLIEAVPYSFVIDTTAESEDGLTLVEPYEVAFTTARLIVQVLPLMPELSGSVRSTMDDFENVWVGDSAYELENGDDGSYIGVMSFDLGSLVGGVVRFEAAAITATQTINQGAPFENLGGEVQVYDVAYEDRTWTAVAPQIMSSIGIMSDNKADSFVSLGVLDTLQSDYDSTQVAQFAFIFPTMVFENDYPDNLEYTNAALSVAYYTP